MTNKTYRKLIEFLNASLENKDVPTLDEGIDIERILTIAKSHRVDNMLYPLMSRVDGFLNTELGQKLNTSYLQAIVKEANQQKEAERVMMAFEKEKIVHMPLKGHIIKNLYPSPDFRQSTDFDIYVPEKHTFDACRVLDRLGYEYDKNTIGFDMHDSYRLGLYTEIEVHKNLMAPDFPKWCRMCKDLIGNMTIVKGLKFRYEFSKEDYYLYMQLHTIKHLKYSSCGIKSIMDIYIYLKNYNDILDWNYIDKVLKKYDLQRIDENLRRLSDYWFGGVDPHDKIIYDLSDYIIESGAFGTKEQYFSGRKVDEKKSQVIIKHLFMPLSEMKIKYPILKKYPFLLPVMWGYRLIYGLIFKKHVISDNLNKTYDVDEEKVKQLSDFKKDLGL